MSVLAELLADKLSTAQHVSPLVVAAELHIAAVLLEQHVEVVALHDHVVELQEGQTALPALLVALEGQHLVYAEACADFSQHVDVVEVHQPVCVVDHDSLALGKIYESAHLLLEAVDIMLNGFRSQHLSHIGLAGGVADHSGAAAQQGDGLVACHLEALHQAQSHEVTYMQGIRGRIEADIEGRLALVDHLLDLFLVGNLRDKSSCY